MEKVLTSYPFKKDKKILYNLNKEPVFFSHPFSEYDILELQNIFLSFGIQEIKVKNVKEGRVIIEKILTSLNYFQNIGYISKSHNQNHNYFNIYKNVTEDFEYQGELAPALEDFFIMNPHFDFIFIELTNSLKNTKLCASIKKIFEMCHADERMPVILLTYENE